MIIFSFSLLTLSLSAFAIIAVCLFIVFAFSQTKQELKRIQFEKEVLYEKEREISMRLVRVENKNLSLQELAQKQESEIQKKNWKHETMQKEFFEKTSEVIHAKNAFKNEQIKIESAEKERRETEENQYFRQWNEHEQLVISKLQSACQNPKRQFVHYENNTLPPSFDGSLKPDFCIKYCSRYIVFDAKKSKNIQTYVQDQAKMTAEKYKEIPEISKTLFFVVPNADFEKCTKTLFSFASFSVQVIPVSAIETTLFLLKKMEAIETISRINPEDQDNIIHYIQSYMQHVSVQNSVNILMAQHSFELEKAKEFLPNDFSKALSTPEQETPSLPFSLQKAKSLAQNTDKQEKTIREFSQAKISV